CLGNFEIAEHECRANGCSGAEQCCSGQCTDVRFDPKNCGSCGHACATGQECSGGECECSNSETVCDDHCVDTNTDPNHCGDCTTQCGTCEHCVGGQCEAVQC